MFCFIWVLITACGAACRPGPAPRSPAILEPLPEDPVRTELWERYVRTINSIEYTSESLQPDSDDGSKYWLDVLVQANSVLWPFVRSASDEDMVWLFSQFGRHGDVLDFGLLFSMPYLTMPSEGPIEIVPFRSEEHGISGEELYELQLAGSRALTRVLMSDRALLERYYHAMLWDGNFLAAGSQGHLGRALDKIAENMKVVQEHEYPWYAPGILVLAAAAGRSGHVQYGTPEELKESWSRLHEWYKSRGESLRFDRRRLIWRPRLLHFLFGYDELLPNVPACPFPDWDGPPCPPRYVVYDYFFEYTELGLEPAEPDRRRTAPRSEPDGR